MMLAKGEGLVGGCVEFSDKLLGALYIVSRAPFVFFNTIALPAY